MRPFSAVPEVVRLVQLGQKVCAQALAMQSPALTCGIYCLPCHAFASRYVLLTWLLALRFAMSAADIPRRLLRASSAAREEEGEMKREKGNQPK
eukprot:1203823-Rhodomonas_salina.3